MSRVVIEGASGYAGMELTRIVGGHPEVELVGVGSGRWAGESVRERLGLPGVVGALRYAKEPEERADIVFLATPAEASSELAPRWLDRGAKVVDLSNAYRADADVVYGLTEHARDAVASASLVANPGCYPTATLNAVLPAMRAGLVAEGAALIVDAKSGVTGAGRKLADHLLFNELAENHYPYRVGNHQHVPEIESRVGRPVVFTPHLLPTRRGLLSSVYLPVREGVSAEEVRSALLAAYEGEPLIQVVSCEEAVGIGRVVNTPFCRVAAGPVVKAGVAQVFGAIDNLLKGAASQAVQNMNLMLGLRETSGLLP
jgi:N-acetyl-gamma-glutamyl-phosphate reductase